MKRKDGARSPPTTRNIPELGISESIPLTEYFPFRVRTPTLWHLIVLNLHQDFETSLGRTGVKSVITSGNV